MGGVTTIVRVAGVLALPTARTWYTEFPWLESMMITSTPSRTSAAARSRSFGRVPMAAPTSSCLFESLDAAGNSRFFFRSVRVVSATSAPFSSTIGSFPFFESRMILFASVSVHGDRPTTRSEDISSDTGVPRSVRKS